MEVNFLCNKENGETIEGYWNYGKKSEYLPRVGDYIRMTLPHCFGTFYGEVVEVEHDYTAESISVFVEERQEQ